MKSDVALAIVPDEPIDWKFQPTLKLLEYRALGIPILANDNAPNCEIVANEVNGLIVSNSAEGISKGMLRFIEAPDFLDECRKNAQRMRTGTTWSDVAERYIPNVYTPLIRANGL
jgi:glycosyltransferase involved in cell wall biosynthesis